MKIGFWSVLTLVALPWLGGCQKDQAWGVEIKPIDVPDGQEVQSCYYMKAPIDAPFDIGHAAINFSKGTHHVHVYYSETPHDDGVEPCFQAVDFEVWHLLVATQREHLDWELPPGVAFRVKPRQQLLVQVHYVNVGQLVTTEGRGAGTIEFQPRPSTEVKEHMGSVFGQQRDIDIAPQSSFSVEGLCTLPREVNIAAFAGHYHFRGKAFIGYKTDLSGERADEFYRTSDFAEPEFGIYGASNPLPVSRSERLMWHCDYDNPTDTRVQFGPREVDQEHCNMFAFYYPAAAEQEFTPCVSYDRCDRPCVQGERCSTAGQCVHE